MGHDQRGSEKVQRRNLLGVSKEARSWLMAMAAVALAAVALGNLVGGPARVGGLPGVGYGDDGVAEDAAEQVCGDAQHGGWIGGCPTTLPCTPAPEGTIRDTEHCDLAVPCDPDAEPGRTVIDDACVQPACTYPASAQATECVAATCDALLAEATGAAAGCKPASATFVTVKADSRNLVVARDQNSVRLTLGTTSPVGSVIRVDSIAVNGADAPCEVSPTKPEGSAIEKHFVMLPEAMRSRAIGMFGPASHVPGEDWAEHVPGTQITVDAKFGTFWPVGEPVRDAQGQWNRLPCRYSIAVTEEFPQAVPLTTVWDFAFSVIPPLPTAVDLGHIQTLGGNDEVDGASVDVAALTEQDVPTAGNRTLLVLAGLATHLEVGPTYDDWGRFWFTLDGRQVGGDKDIALPVEASPTAASLVVASGTYDAPLVYHACFHGKYKDGGLWVDGEGPVETCSRLYVYQAATLAPRKVQALGVGPLLSELDEESLPYVVVPHLP